ncbi:MAG: gliding motility-associated C-terminal domain-containing protein [Ferruginibacter sp.]
MKLRLFFRITIGLFCLGIQAPIAAQVCTGSLGDAVVNVDFGSGNNPGAALSTSITTYNFTSSSCPNDGSYTVVNNTSGCFGGSWHNMPEDHTPNDVNGYMMLVNASFNPGDFYLDTVRNLCANTTYEFAAWIANVLLPTACSPNPIMPKLVFNIETITGTVLGTYSTGDIGSSASPTWTQYGLFFKTPANTNSVVIRLTNTAPGGCGNDIALDDITFRPCGPAVFLTGNSNQSDFDFCTGNKMPVSMVVTIGAGYTAPTLQWQESTDNGSTWTDIAGAVAATYTVTKSSIGIYKYRVMVADGSNIFISSCRIASTVLTLTIHDLPIATAANDGPVCENTVLNLSATGGVSYAWQGPAGFSSTAANPALVAKINSTGQYNLIATDQFGCKDTTSTIVAVDPQPNATINADKSICEGDSTVLIAGGGASYLWSPAIGLATTTSASTIAKPTDTTIYSVIISNNNCTDTATVKVSVVKKPVANAGADKVILKGRSVILDGVVTGGGARYFWSPPNFLDDSFIQAPVATPPTDQLYTLNAISNLGCGSSTDDVFIKVYNDLYIPTAFTPNNDGLNDTWHIAALAVFPNAKVLVYNRYGNLVFESTGNNKDWNGYFRNTAMPAGAYTYMIDLKNDRPVLKGMVMIVK